MFICFVCFAAPGPGRFFYVFFIKSKKTSKKTAFFCIFTKKNENIL